MRTVLVVILLLAVPVAGALPSTNPRDVIIYATDVENIGLSTARGIGDVVVYNVSEPVIFGGALMTIKVVDHVGASYNDAGDWWLALGDCLFGVEPSCFVALAERAPEAVVIVTTLNDRVASDATKYGQSVEASLATAPVVIAEHGAMGATAAIERTRQYLALP